MPGAPPLHHPRPHGHVSAAIHRVHGKKQRVQRYGSLADLKETRTLIVGTDQVAVDSFGATLLGKTAADLPFIAKAEALGAGTADYRSLSPVEVSA